MIFGSLSDLALEQTDYSAAIRCCNEKKVPGDSSRIAGQDVLGQQLSPAHFRGPSARAKSSALAESLALAQDDNVFLTERRIPRSAQNDKRAGALLPRL